MKRVLSVVLIRVCECLQSGFACRKIVSTIVPSFPFSRVTPFERRNYGPWEDAYIIVLKQGAGPAYVHPHRSPSYCPTNSVRSSKANILVFIVLFEIYMCCFYKLGVLFPLSSKCNYLRRGLRPYFLHRSEDAFRQGNQVAVENMAVLKYKGYSEELDEKGVQ
ncbi:hypothetical protein EDD85DRAFT_797411 [Armillaria nabsnona]|nr:hypothetical protein EDD85DRAFT_797411 [Armillaria nabsnona]